MNLDFPQYREIRICSASAENWLRFENIRNFQKSFDFRKLWQKVLSQIFFFTFSGIFFKKFFLAKMAWIDPYMKYVILKSFSMSCGIAVFYPRKKITIFLICFLTKSFDNSWKNEPRRNIARQKLASAARFEVYEEFSKNLIFRTLNLSLKILSKNEIFRKLFINFKSSHRSEFLSYNIPTRLIFSGIIQTFHSNKNKNHQNFFSWVKYSYSAWHWKWLPF